MKRSQEILSLGRSKVGAEPAELEFTLAATDLVSL